MSRVTNYLQVVGSEPNYKHDERPNAEAMRNAALVVNYLFKELKAIFPAWKNSFGSDVTEDSVKQNWIKTFILAGITNVDQIRLGVNACRLSDKPFMPSAGEFVAWCKPSPRHFGLPAVDEAFRLAVAAAHPAVGETNVSPAVYYAARKVGFWALNNGTEKEVFASFREAYSEAVELIAQGVELGDASVGIEHKPATVASESDIEHGGKVIASILKNLKKGE